MCMCTLQSKPRSGYYFTDMVYVHSKLNSFVLLLAFVLTTLATVPGFAWCIGDNGHFEVEYVGAGNCGDGANDSSGNITGKASIQTAEAHCESCRHFSLESDETVSKKRTPPKATIQPGFFALNTIPTISSQKTKLVVGNLVPQPPPRISQAILEHRTIVLLN